MRIETQGNIDQEILELVEATVVSLDKFWTGRLKEKYGLVYKIPRVVLFDWKVMTSCGLGVRSFGPFYCSGDNTVYIDPRWFESLEKDYGAKVSPFVISFIVAHEVSHAVQKMRGIFQRIFSPGGPESMRVRGELACDYWAGCWIRYALTSEDFPWAITEQDIYDCLYAATKVGDDSVQSWKTGKVELEKYGHGSSKFRAQWLSQGILDGDPFQRDPFKVANLDLS